MSPPASVSDDRSLVHSGLRWTPSSTQGFERVIKPMKYQITNVSNKWDNSNMIKQKYWLLLKFHVSENYFQLLQCAKVDGCSITLLVHLMCFLWKPQKFRVLLKALPALYGCCRCQAGEVPREWGMTVPQHQGTASCRDLLLEKETEWSHRLQGCAARPASCAGHKALFQTLQFIKCEKSPRLNQSTELPVQAAGLMEKEQESSASSSSGENEFGFMGLHLIWQSKIATRCDLALV